MPFQTETISDSKFLVYKTGEEKLSHELICDHEQSRTNFAIYLKKNLTITLESTNTAPELSKVIQDILEKWRNRKKNILIHHTIQFPLLSETQSKTNRRN